LAFIEKILLDILYDNIEDTASKEMHAFLDLIIAQLYLYVLKRISITTNNRATTASETELSKSLRGQLNSSSRMKCKLEDAKDNVSITTMNSNQNLPRKPSSNNLIDLTQSACTHKRVISPPSARYRIIINTDITTRPPNLRNYTNLSKQVDSLCDNRHRYFIDLNYYGDNKTLLESGCYTIWLGNH